MNPFSIITVKTADYDPISRSVELICHFEWGKPAVTNIVFCPIAQFEVAPIPIILIKTSLFGKIRVYLDGTDWQYWGETGLMEAVISGKNQLLCGPTFEDFHQIPTPDQARYLKELLSAWGNERIAPIYLEQFRPCFNVQFTEENTVHSYSQIGGLPFAPPGFIYPTDSNGEIAVFIGQFDLRALHKEYSQHFPINQPGILYLFGEIDKTEETPCISELIPIFLPEPTDLVEIPLPDSLEEFGPMEQVAISIFPAFSIPKENSAYFYHLPNVPTNQEDANIQFANGLIEYYYPNDLKIGGHPNPIQNSLEVEAAFKYLGRGWYEKERKDFYDYPKAIEECLPEAYNWVPIIQVWNGSRPFNQWTNYQGIFSDGIDDWLYLMIKVSDLKAGNFDQTITISQTT